MKIYRLIAVLLFCTSFGFIACDDMNSLHDPYLKKGEDLRVGKLDSTRLFSGMDRAMLMCWVSDSRSKKLQVVNTSNNIEQWYDLERINPEDTIRLILPAGLIEEGTNNLQMRTWNEKKSISSILMNETVSAFGKGYQRTLAQISCQAYYRTNNRLILVCSAYPQGAIALEIKCKDSAGNEKIMVYFNNADNQKKWEKQFDPASTFFSTPPTSGVISDVASQSVEYRSIYVPSASCIDIAKTEFAAMPVYEP